MVAALRFVRAGEIAVAGKVRISTFSSAPAMATPLIASGYAVVLLRREGRTGGDATGHACNRTSAPWHSQATMPRITMLSWASSTMTASPSGPCWTGSLRSPGRMAGSGKPLRRRGGERPRGMSGPCAWVISLDACPALSKRAMPFRGRASPDGGPSRPSTVRSRAASARKKWRH